MEGNIIVTKQADRCQVKKFMLSVIEAQRPENVRQIISVVQQTYTLPEDQITPILIELENEGKLHFTKKGHTNASTQKPIPFKTYVLSNRAAWFWFTIILAIITTLAVFVIPEGVYPIVYIRYALGVVFVLFLPGFAFIKTLFPLDAPIKTGSENFDAIERIVLSLGLSLALVPIAGLILNYTLWGIRLVPIIVILLTLTIVFSTVAILREYYTSNKYNIAYGRRK